VTAREQCDILFDRAAPYDADMPTMAPLIPHDEAQPSGAPCGSRSRDRQAQVEWKHNSPTGAGRCRLRAALVFTGDAEGNVIALDAGQEKYLDFQCGSSVLRPPCPLLSTASNMSRSLRVRHSCLALP